MALNWSVENVLLGAVSATTTKYGDAAPKKRRVLGAYFNQTDAITGNGSNNYTIAVKAGSTTIASIQFVAGVDHTANTPDALTMASAGSVDADHIVGAGTPISVVCTKAGTAANLSADAQVSLCVAPVEMV
jgi:hypothetical protein